MSDPLDSALWAGGGTIAGLLLSLLKSSGSRNVVTLDETLVRLTTSIDSLSKEVRDLRETNVGIAKDIGGLKERDAQFEREMVRLRRVVHRWGAFLQKIVLRTATGEHVKIEVPALPDDEDDDEP